HRLGLHAALGAEAEKHPQIMQVRLGGADGKALFGDEEVVVILHPRMGKPASGHTDTPLGTRLSPGRTLSCSCDLAHGPCAPGAAAARAATGQRCRAEERARTSTLHSRHTAPTPKKLAPKPSDCVVKPRTNEPMPMPTSTALSCRWKTMPVRQAETLSAINVPRMTRFPVKPKPASTALAKAAHGEPNQASATTPAPKRKSVGTSTRTRPNRSDSPPATSPPSMPKEDRAKKYQE